MIGSRVATAIEGAYRERTTLTPVGAAAEAIILFAERADYDAFTEGEARLAGLRPAGHTSRGLVALAAGERSASDVAATLVHELTHLLNRRVECGFVVHHPNPSSGSTIAALRRAV